jgi:hypothetical protein
MNNPAASRWGIETDLLAEPALHYNFKISLQRSGEFTLTRLNRVGNIAFSDLDDEILQQPMADGCRAVTT